MAKDVMRALAVSAVVGSVLSLIHCREMFRVAGAAAFCNWHVYTSYLVPFAVSLASARLARRGQGQGGGLEDRGRFDHR